MSLFSFMLNEPPAPIATPLDEAVKAFLDTLPPGEGAVGCNYIWYAFNRTNDACFEEFEDACGRVAQTSIRYGRRFIEGIDEAGARHVYTGSFR